MRKTKQNIYSDCLRFRAVALFVLRGGIIFILIFLSVPFFASAQTVSLSPQNSNVNANQQFSIDVLINSATNVFGFGFDLSFDPSLMAFDSAIDGGFLSKNNIDQISLMTGVNPAGNLVFGITRLGAGSGGVSGSGTVVKLNFRSLAKSGFGAFSFSKNNICVLSGDRCNYVPATWQGANIVIASVSAPSDIVPPTVSITSPTNGSSISGIITISANASDNVAVAGIQFKLDGATLGSENTTSPYLISWNTATVSNGSHSLTATARDTSGNQTTSNAVTITVNNVTVTPPPMPTNGVGATIDTTPPSVPSNTKISMSGNQVVITWSNPTDSDFRGITIIRKQGSSPTSRTDGNIVYNNNLQNFIDSVDSSKTFYYAVYSYDNNNNYTQPVILKAEPGQTFVVSQPPTQTASPTPIGIVTPGSTTTSSQIIIPSTISSSYEFIRYLTIGKSGDDVRELQKILATNPNIYPEAKITGYFGLATQRAVQRFQEAYGIANYSSVGYGNVGPLTRTRLNQLISYKKNSSSTATSSAEQSRQTLIANLKELIAKIEAQIAVLFEQLKKIKAGQ